MGSEENNTWADYIVKVPMNDTSLGIFDLCGLPCAPFFGGLVASFAIDAKYLLEVENQWVDEYFKKFRGRIHGLPGSLIADFREAQSAHDEKAIAAPLTAMIIDNIDSGLPTADDLPSFKHEYASLLVRQRAEEEVLKMLSFAVRNRSPPKASEPQQQKRPRFKGVTQR